MARLYARITMRLPRLGERFGQPRLASWQPSSGQAVSGREAGRPGRSGEAQRTAATSGSRRSDIGDACCRFAALKLLRGRYHAVGHEAALGAVLEDEQGGGRKIPDRLGQQDAYDDRIGHLGADDRDDGRRQRTGHQAD